LAAVLALCGGLALSGCGRPSAPLRIGLNLWPPYGMLELAEAKGYFKEEGVEVRLFVAGSLSETRRAFETGKLDGLATTIVETMVARDGTGRDPRIVRVVNFSDGADVIIASENIRSISDLRDKTVGVEMASLGMFLLSRALASADLTLDDLQVVSKDPGVMIDELRNGRLDAVVVYPPESLQLAGEAGFRTIFSSADIPGEVVDLIAFEQSVLRDRPAEVAAFLRALDRAHRFLQEDPAEACRVMGRAWSINPEAFGELLAHGIRMVPPAEQSDYLAPGGRMEEVIRLVGRALQQARIISKAPAPSELLPQP
jgi:NitT/TauT family transport system substrate-binding protein